MERLYQLTRLVARTTRRYIRCGVCGPMPQACHAATSRICCQAEWQEGHEEYMSRQVVVPGAQILRHTHGAVEKVSPRARVLAFLMPVEQGM